MENLDWFSASAFGTLLLGCLMLGAFCLSLVFGGVALYFSGTIRKMLPSSWRKKSTVDTIVEIAALIPFCFLSCFFIFEIGKDHSWW